MAGRVRHPIDTKVLERYITRNVPEIQVPLDSNPTYQLTSPHDQRYVEREHHIIARLGSTDVPVPPAYCLCDDSTVLGAPFYIMSFLDGRIIEGPAMPDETIYAAQSYAEDADTGVPVGELPHFEDFLSFFGSRSAEDAATRPRDRGTLIYGDYKIDKLVFHKTEPRVSKVLYWEMSTIGHPLSELASIMHPFYSAEMLTNSHFASPSSATASSSDDKHTSSTVAHPGFLPGATPGLPDPQTILHWHVETSYSGINGSSNIGKWNPSPEISWAATFSMFRQAAICQGITAWVVTLQASSESARKHADAWFSIAKFAWELMTRERAKTKDTRKVAVKL
ncbi:phosphotransferase enzyme family protein [Xylariaceae sp. FL1651]|nr:phosphotransferase enzyme family protein [Xylariaceae sp. FL1651]